MKFCPECGTKLEIETKFCPECGYKITQNEEENVKLTSEEYVKKVLSDFQETSISIVPNIDDKKKIAASKSIANQINPAIIIGLLDTSVFSNGKSGAVFTGESVYLKEAFGDMHVFKYEGITKVDFEIDSFFNDKEKEIKIKRLTVEYGDESQVVTSRDLSDNFPLKLISDVLVGIPSTVEDIQVNDQIVELKDLDSDIIGLYFKIVILYMQRKGRAIDAGEYKEFLSLMAKVNVSKEMEIELRMYRFSKVDDSNDSIEVMIGKLKEQLDQQNISRNAVMQSLGMNILSLSEENFDNWKKDEELKSILGMLSVNEQQIKFALRKIKMEKNIINERLDDNQVKEVMTELVALGTGAGISLSALALTGAASGLGASLSSGALALAFGSGGAFVGAALVAAGSYGAYKGIKYLAGTSESEKYGVRINMLKDRMILNQRATTYIIEDVNWLNQEINSLALKLRESSEMDVQISEALEQSIYREEFKDGEISNLSIKLKQSGERIKDLVAELEYYSSLNDSTTDSGMLVEKDQAYIELESLVAQLPQKLNEAKLIELLDNNVNKVKYSEIIMSIYRLNSDGEHILDENMDLDKLDKLYNILSEVGYFDTTSSAVAQSKAMAKKGFGTLKKSIFGGE